MRSVGPRPSARNRWVVRKYTALLPHPVRCTTSTLARASTSASIASRCPSRKTASGRPVNNRSASRRWSESAMRRAWQEGVAHTLNDASGGVDLRPWRWVPCSETIARLSRSRRSGDEAWQDRCAGVRLPRGADRHRVDDRHDLPRSRVRDAARQRRLLQHRHGADALDHRRPALRRHRPRQRRGSRAVAVRRRRSGNRAPAGRRAGGRRRSSSASATPTTSTRTSTASPTTRWTTFIGGATASTTAASPGSGPRCRRPASSASGWRAPKAPDVRR